VLLREAEVAGHGLVDVLLEDERIAAIGHGLSADVVIDCARAAVLPGLHDHHIHLLAAAAAAASVSCGPPDVRTADGFAAALRAARPIGGWIRGVGYDEGVAGRLDAEALDLLLPDVPTRVQHRSGALWILNSAGLALVGADAATDVAGIERDGCGRPNGRLWRADSWLADRLDVEVPADLGSVSRLLAGYGITGVTDATPNLSTSAKAALTGGAVAQRLTLLGDAGGFAPYKIVLADHDLPSWDSLRDSIAATRPRAVALHCVSAAALLLALALLEDVGSVAGDRVEHAAVAPPEAAARLAAMRVAVVTQPSLPGRRGDDYLERVDASDQPYLWPFRSLLAAGVLVGCSSDAPYGDADPWASIAAAVERRTPSGRPIAAHERVTAADALHAYLGLPDHPGGPSRRVAVGEAADLVLLQQPLAVTLAEPRTTRVRATFIAGRQVAGDELP
jgi:predicted amidohydrolase YtcJ